MKTISTLFASLILSSSIFAANGRPTSTLTVKSATKADIVVVVDDKRYDLGTNAIMISDLDPCDHDVAVYLERGNNGVNCFEKTFDKVFSSSVQLKPRTNLEIAIDDCGSITMNETTSRRPVFGDTWNGENYFRDHN